MLNGALQETTNNGTQSSVIGSDPIIWGRGFNGDWEGFGAEVIVYTENLSDADLQKINSYLAIKYGVTLSGGTLDYVSASGATVWSATTNAGYNNDIAGIGREDAQALSQLKSRSVNSDSLVTMSGDSMNIADHEFLLWGNDDGSISEFTGTEAPAGLERLAREWTIQEEGDVGTVRIEVSTGDLPSFTGDLYFLVDSTDSDLTDATPVLMSQSGSTWYIDYNFSGTHFSFGAAATPIVNIEVDTGSIAESGGVAIVTATITGGSLLTTGTVTLAFSGTASSGDYTASNSGVITIPFGSTTGAITLTATQDTSDELDETIDVSIASLTNMLTGTQTTGSTTIVDDDTVTAELSLSTTSVPETNGTGQIIVLLSGGTVET